MRPCAMVLLSYAKWLFGHASADRERTQRGEYQAQHRYAAADQMS